MMSFEIEPLFMTNCPITGCTSAFTSNEALSIHLRNDSHRPKRRVDRQISQYIENSLSRRVFSGLGRFVSELLLVPFNLCVSAVTITYNTTGEIKEMSETFAKNDVGEACSMAYHIPLHLIQSILFIVSNTMMVPFFGFMEAYSCRERIIGYKTEEVFE